MRIQILILGFKGSKANVTNLGLSNVSVELLESESFVQLGLLDVCSISKICPSENKSLQIFNFLKLFL